MRLGSRIITTLAVAFLLAPTFLPGADDAAKPAAAVKKTAIKSPGATSAVVKAKPAAAAPAPVPGKENKEHSSGSVPSFPRYELFLGYSNFRALSDPGNRIAWLSGGSTSFAINANRYFGFVGDFGAYHATHFGPGAPPTGATVPAYGDVYTYMFGPRLSFRHDRVTPFVQALFGGAHASDVTLNGCTGIGCTPLPFENSFTFTAGGGIDITLSRHVALRLIQAEYVMTDFKNPTMGTGSSGHQNDARLSAGILFRFGGEHRPPPPPPPPPMLPLTASCAADKGMVYVGSGDSVTVRAQVGGAENNPFIYTWTSTGGTATGTAAEVQWSSAGLAAGDYTVSAHVDAGRGGSTNCSAGIRVEPRPSRPPTVSCMANPTSVVVGQQAQITATANNPDNVPLTYTWRSNGGQVVGSGPSVSFDSTGLAPNRYTVMGHVDDGRGNTADCSVNVDAQAPANAALPPADLEARLALHSIYFATAQPTPEHPDGGLLPSQQDTLRTLAVDFKKYLEFKPDAHLTLEGHADQRGSVDYNNALTERRVTRCKNFLVEQGVPAANIDTRSLGKEQGLDAAQVKEQMEQNPDLTPEERQKLFSNMPAIVLAQNRRVDVVLSGTGQTSIRRYPFNARDALTLISTQHTGTARRTAPAGKPKPKPQ